jgi:hypothetical protein
MLRFPKGFQIEKKLWNFWQIKLITKEENKLPMFSDRGEVFVKGLKFDLEN